MYHYCKDEFEWLMNMLKESNCFSKWDGVAKFIDGGLLELRYMKKNDLVTYFTMKVNISKKLMEKMLLLSIKRINMLNVNLKNQHFTEQMKMVK